MGADVSRDRREIGRGGEDIAASWLEAHGLKIRARGYRNHHGEIDIIAEEGETVVFVEVKRRDAGGPGGEPWEKVDARKLSRICRVGQIYAVDEKLVDRPLRVDVVGIETTGGEAAVTHYRDVTRFKSRPRG